MPRRPPPSVIERAIAAISPAWAISRYRSRVTFAALGGYETGRKSDRLANYRPGAGDSDADTVGDLIDLRGMSRDQTRRNPIALAAIETQVTNVVGTGLSLEPAPDRKFLRMTEDAADTWRDAAEREWCTWSDSKFCDADGELNFYGLQELAFRSMLESGDAFVLLASKQRRGWPYTMALQVIEADRVSNPKRAQDTDAITGGIERDASGAPIAVHVSNRHPGRLTGHASMEWRRIPIRGESGRVNVIHLTRKLRPGQTRGIPALAPVIGILKQLERYSNAEVDAAVNSAAMAVFVKMDPDAFQDIYTEDTQSDIIDSAKKWDGTLKSGAAMNLLPGEDVSSPTPGRPNPNFDPFVGAVMRQIGMALGIPYEVLVKHFQASYSAARAALLDAWRTWRHRRAFVAANLCQVVWEEFLADMVATRRLSASGFWSDPIYRAAWSKASWGGDGMGAIDPEKEAIAAQLRVEMGLTTLEEEIMAYDGGDWSEKHERQTAIQAARVKDKLAAPADQPKPGAAAPAPKPARSAESLNSGDL